MNLPLSAPGLLPLALGAYFWARWLRKRYPKARYTAHLLVSAVAIPLVAMSTSMIMLARAFHGVSYVSAAEKQSVLAWNIAAAMHSTTIGIGLMVVVLILLAVYHSRLSNDAWRGPPLGDGEDKQG